MSQKEIWRIRKLVQRKFPLEGQKCEHCGETHKLHRHHRDENIRNNNSSNIAYLCKSCHYKLHSRVKPLWAIAIMQGI